MSNELKIGLAVLFAALGVFFGIRFLEGTPLLGAGYDVVAVFDDARGLEPGNPVQMSGVRIGSIRRVALSDDGRRVFVTLAMERGARVPRGSRVTIGGFAALGDVNVELTPPEGAVAGRPLTSGDTLVARGATDLFGAIQQNAAPIVARADTLLGQFLGTYRRAEPVVVDRANDLAAAAAQIRFVTTALSRAVLAENERGSFNRVGDTFEQLNRAAAAAERAALNLETLTAEFSTGFGGGRSRALADTLAGSVAQLSATLRQLEGSLGGLDATTAQLDTTLALVNSPDGTLGLLLRDPSLYHNANGAAASLQQLLTDFQNNPARYTRGLVRVF